MAPSSKPPEALTVRRSEFRKDRQRYFDAALESGRPLHILDERGDVVAIVSTPRDKRPIGCESMIDPTERLDALESRVTRIEKVLVNLARCVYGWGLENGRSRFRRPGVASTPYTRGQYPSPFDPIADLINKRDDEGSDD